ncbi:AAA family ATPase [Pseudomonas sp. KnCO4]|uniref:AAA family ATPase n=1 Tax=Pseudomonas sp. KnCO4 TaxID=3381355 RepID=UPI003878324D
MQGRKSNSFRLLDATVHLVSQNHYTRDEAPSNTIRFSLNENDNNDSTWVTILIGRNGIGKSRFLAAIADVFYRLSESTKIPSRNRSEVVLRYLANGAEVCLKSLNGKFKIHVNGEPVSDLGKVPVPSKVIAITTTPFDKFRISNLRANAVFGSSSNCYEYLGLRDRSGRAYALAPLMRAVEGLFNLSSERARRLDRIAGVFNFLGFEPRIEVTYRAKASLLSELLEDDPLKFSKSLNQYAPYGGGVSDEDYQALIKAARIFVAKSLDGHTVSIGSDFETHENDGGLYSLLEPLRKLRVILPVGVLINRQDGIKVDLLSASSGEMSLVTAFLGLASVIQDGSLILIDEPEVSLHPEWQSGYIDLLQKTFADYKNCHFVIATHSPLIVADIDASNSNVVVMERNASADIESTDISGKSSDHILATAFQTPGKNNLYLRQEIIKALRLAADGEVRSEEFQSTVDWLVGLLPKLDDEPSVSRVIMNLQEVAIDAGDEK